MNHRVMAFVRALMRSAGWRFWWTLALIVLLPLTEGVGLALLLPTLEAAGLDLHNQGQAGHLARLVWRGFAAVGAHPGFLALLVIYVLVIGLRTILERNRSVSVWIVQQDFEDDLRRRLYRAIAGANWLFITRSRLADFTHALTAELSRVAECVSSWTMIAGDVVLGASYLVVAFVLSPAITLMVLAAGATLAFAMRGKTSRIERHGADLARASQICSTRRPTSICRASKPRARMAPTIATTRFLPTSAGASQPLTSPPRANRSLSADGSKSAPR